MFQSKKNAAIVLGVACLLGLFVAWQWPRQQAMLAVTADHSPSLPTTLSRVGDVHAEAVEPTTESNRGELQSSFHYEQGLFSDSPTGRTLTTFFSALEQTGDDSSREYERLFSLVKADRAAPRELVNAYRRLGGAATMDHYKILYTLVELKSAEAAALFVDVAMTALPNKSVAEHDNDNDQERAIRFRAVAGLETLAQQGNASARQTLVQVIENSTDNALRADAVRGFLLSTRNIETDSAYMRSLLPNEQHYLVTTQLRPPTPPASPVVGN